MPGFNRKGPRGQGSQTGRKTGKCNPNVQISNETKAADEPENRLGIQRGLGMRKGFRFGRRNDQDNSSTR